MAYPNGYHSQDSTDFDRLIEQQDQELARDGVVSPLTRLQLQALAEGKPIPHVWDTPGIREATERLLRGQRTPSGNVDDDTWYFDGGDD